MDAIEQAANVSVARGCGFCGLAILCTMLGLSFDPAVSAKVGAVSSLLLSLALIFKASRAMGLPYKRTETWIMLALADRPHPSVAQAVIGKALHRTLLRYARYAAFVSMVLFAAAIIFALARI